MKRNNYSQYDKGQEVSGVTLQQHQNQVIESLNSIIQALGLDSNEVTILWGLERDTNEPGYDISAGAVFTNGEIFEVDAFQSPDGSPSPHMHPVTLAVGDQVRFGDGIFRTAHEDHKYALSSSSIEPGSVAWAGLTRLEDKLRTTVGVDQAIADLVDGAVTYTTLKALETAVNQNKTDLQAVSDSLDDYKDEIKGVTNWVFVEGQSTAPSFDASNNDGGLSPVGQTQRFVIFNNAEARIQPADIVVAPGEKRVVKLFSSFFFEKNGDLHRFNVGLHYRVGSGPWTLIRLKEMKSRDFVMYGTLFGHLELTSTPVNYLEFALSFQITSADSSASVVNIGLDDYVEFDAIY